MRWILSNGLRRFQKARLTCCKLTISTYHNQGGRKCQTEGTTEVTVIMYGPHKYASHDTSDCEHGCGCSMGGSMSHGPAGIDPFGHCPNNPVSGPAQPSDHDYEDCVNGRIKDLERDLREAEEAVNIVECARKGTKVDLVARLCEVEKIVDGLIEAFKVVHHNLLKQAEEITENIGEQE